MKYLFLLIISSSVFAQHAEQPKVEDTEDGRANMVVFSLKDLSSKKVMTLERSPYFDHFLRLKDSKKESLQKADSRLANNLDKDFAALYLKSMYEIPSIEGKCKGVYTLSLRGEDQEICAKDEQKTQLIRSFIQLLEKQF